MNKTDEVIEKWGIKNIKEKDKFELTSKLI